MDETWKRIEAWLAQNAPEILADLQAPAAPQDIQNTERALGQQLPDEMAASYRIHNGSRGGAAPLLGKWRLLSLDQIEERWRELNTFNENQKDAEDEFGDKEFETQTDPGIQEGWWRNAWIPIASNGSGDFLCVDLDPAPGGKRGQIISYLHADGSRKRVANSFGKWLGQFADDLERGAFIVSDGWLEPASEA
jgi:cell wall assembly regulator SMI1